MLHGSDFRFQRHLELWKEQNKQIKRVVVGTLIFGFLVLIRVLIPLHTETENSIAVIQNLNTEKDSLSQINSIYLNLEESLKKVQQTIQAEPWEMEKENLIRKFAEINRTGHQVDAQKIADSTILNIVTLIKQRIIKPLDNVLEVIDLKNISLPELSNQIEDFYRFIRQWQEEHIGERWFGTISEKNREIFELTRGLNSRTQNLAEELQRKEIALKMEYQNRNEMITTISSEVSRAKTDLQKVLQDLLPKWLQGLINVEQMIQLYPVCLLILMLYSAWIVFILSRHYHYVATHMMVAVQEKTDLALSSIWTFTQKGKRDVVLTKILYSFYIIIIWLFFEYGVFISSYWFKASTTEHVIFNHDIYIVFIWISRLLFAGMLIFIFLCRQLTCIRKSSPGWPDLNNK
jgi:ferritin-like protein